MRWFRTSLVGALIPALMLVGQVPVNGAARFAAAKSSVASRACPLGALAKAKGRVKISFWYDWTDRRGEITRQLVDRYNASQPKVQVEASFRGMNEVPLAMFADYQRAVAAGKGPDLISINARNTRRMIDSRTTVAASTCIAADGADFSDLLPAVQATATNGGSLVAIPWGAGGTVLYFSRPAFLKAGLDPERPPSNISELRAASKALMTSGAARHGLSVLAVGATVKWLFDADGTPWWIANEKGLAERSVLGTAAGRVVVGQLSDMSRSGELIAFPPAPSPDYLLALGSGDVGMVLAPAGLLGDLQAYAASKNIPPSFLGVGPNPGVSQAKNFVLEGAGAPLWIVKGTKNDRREAAYQFAKWLLEPAQIVAWVVGTGSVPIRISAASSPAMVDFWKTNPLSKVAYDQVAGSDAGEVARTGASKVDGIINEAVSAILIKGVDPTAALTTALPLVDAALAEYNANLAAVCLAAAKSKAEVAACGKAI